MRSGTEIFICVGVLLLSAIGLTFYIIDLVNAERAIITGIVIDKELTIDGNYPGNTRVQYFNYYTIIESKEGTVKLESQELYTKTFKGETVTVEYGIGKYENYFRRIIK